MKAIYILLSATLLFTACNTETKDNPTSKNNELLNYIEKKYKTRDISTQTGVKFIKGGKMINYCQLTVSNSSVINAENCDVRKVTSDIILKFFRSIRDNEKDKTDLLKMNIIRNGEVKKYESDYLTLEKIEKSYACLNDAVEFIQNQDYQRAAKVLDTRFEKPGRIDLINFHKRGFKAYGKIKSYYIDSFDYGDSEYKDTMIQALTIYGTVNWERKSAQVIYTILLNKKLAKILSVEFHYL